LVEIIEWFVKNYPDVKKSMQNCEHSSSISEVNPYHIEGDCWSHTMLVCKVAELKGFNIEVQIASMLHDIGKPNMRKINPKNNHTQFFGHEEESAKLAKPILKKLASSKFINPAKIDYILDLIRYHSIFYKSSKEDLESRFDKEFIEDLSNLKICDTLGRFSNYN